MKPSCPASWIMAATSSARICERERERGRGLFICYQQRQDLRPRRPRRRLNEYCANYHGVLSWCDIYCKNINHNDARLCHPAAPGSAAPPAITANPESNGKNSSNVGFIETVQMSAAYCAFNDNNNNIIYECQKISDPTFVCYQKYLSI